MRAAALVVVLGLGAGVARAEDDKKDSMTVLPWTNASLVFGTAAKNGVVEYTHLGESSPLLLYLKASAPLDEGTRIAAFTSTDGLARGFAAAFQVGVDGRARELQALRRRHAEAVRGLEELLHADGLVDEKQAFVKRHALPSNDDAIARYLCGANSTCTPERVGAAVCNRLGPLGTRSCSDGAGATELANEVVKQWCSPVDPDANATLLDNCFVARFWLQKQRQQVKFEKVRQLVVDRDLVDRMWKVLEVADAKKAEELLTRYGSGGKAQAVLDERKTVEEAFKKVARAVALERRDLLLTGIGRGSTTAFTLDGRIGYDRLPVYQDDLAAAPRTEVKMDVGLGANVTHYPAWWKGAAATLRAGVEHTIDPTVSRVSRCVATASTQPIISGQSCDANTLFRMGPAPAATTGVYVRAALSYQYAGEHAENDLVPGVELRGGVEGLGASKMLTTRLTLFGTPVAGAAAARVGVAVDVAYALDATPRWVVTPLIFVGASFAGLMAAP